MRDVQPLSSNQPDDRYRPRRRCGQLPPSRAEICDSPVMGIRYYARAIDDADIAWLTTYPCACECRDPRPHRREPLAEVGTLTLDKAWWEFQQLFDATGLEAGRPAGRLVISQPDLLTRLPYEPSYGLVSAVHVAEAAADLATVTDDEVRALVRRGRQSDQRANRSEQWYVTEYLEQAREYTERLADQGLALRYVIT